MVTELPNAPQTNHTVADTHHDSMLPQWPQWVVGLGLLWAYLVTLTRGFQLPNDWAKTHWLVTYEVGFVKRALIGTLIKPLLMWDVLTPYAKDVINVVATLFLVAFCIVVGVIAYQILRSGGFRLDTVMLVFAFVTSPYVVMSANLNGYMDNILVLVTFFTIIAVWKERPWLAACILTIGVLVHENIFLQGFPAVIFAGMLMMIQEYQYLKRVSSLLPLLQQLFTPFLLPLSMFAAVFCYQSFIIGKGPMYLKIFAQMDAYDIYSDPMVVRWASGAYVESFVNYYDWQAGEFFTRIFAMPYLLNILPVLTLLIYYGIRAMRQVYASIIGTTMVLTVALIPLLLHIIATDTSRFWTYPIFTTLLVIWILHRGVPTEKLSTSMPQHFIALAFVVVFINIMTMTPLYGGIDRFEGLLRAIVYLPSLLAILFYAWYRQGIQATAGNISVGG